MSETLKIAQTPQKTFALWSSEEFSEDWMAPSSGQSLSGVHKQLPVKYCHSHHTQ